MGTGWGSGAGEGTQRVCKMSGIQSLLKTEKDAQEIVSKARQCMYTNELPQLPQLHFQTHSADTNIPFLFPLSPPFADRAQKLKAAKTDAQAEIEAYKAKKAAELKKFEDEFAGSNQKLEADADTEVQTELVKIKKTAEEKKTAVVKLLLESVTTPKPGLHVNATSA
ncbi:hypothetical protein PMKS-003934 [Pichia membranifaciens]|uniref:V-type proton ATPase subunit G n=1 Tax=Pichia membranifaciens TaxID=4926 RepID=A0A1Q2YLJ6_9ASCO|nr:hypothetical protein PMKS-003934 [Pichia membranifaciens]